ncbi:MAG: DUF4105 domain-containing protein [Alphaproteobacteria bacterium]|nr:DUF4105 domain-containing protein [Alphaproteobacteria bacterium]MCB9695871.1 DUF4105 domain-containing protein [Alphaproteobacteria bacterium]
MWWVAAALAGSVCGGDDGPHVSLVTIAPGGDLFSSMGHTALVFEGGWLQQPEAYDWGAFHQSPDAMLLFLRGELPYFLHHQRWTRLVAKTADQRRTMLVQRLDLPEDVVLGLLERVEAESAPDRRDYTYRWDTANCSTRARDALDTATDGRLRSLLGHPVDATARTEGARHLWRWPIPAFAWRFVTSHALDRPLDGWAWSMVPQRLMEELDATDLVAERCVAEAAYGFAPAEPPARWPWVIPGLLGSAVLLAARGRPRLTGALIAVYGLVLALLGTSSFLLWTVTGLPGVGPTANWLLAGPQSWAWLAVGWRRTRGPLTGGWRALVAALAALGASSPLVLLVPGHADTTEQIAAFLPGLIACALASVAIGRHSAARSSVL